MARNVVGGLIQCSNALNDPSATVPQIRDAMFEKHLPFIEEAGKKGVQILSLQEVFNGPYFCPSQDSKWCDIAEEVPNGPTIQRLAVIAKKYKMAIVVPVYEREMAGVYYNTAAVLDADGTYLGKYRKQHIPQVKGFWEKFYFTPGTGGYPVFETAVGKVGVYICYDRHFPEGWRALGLAGAQLVYNPSATHRGLSSYLWQLDQPAAAVANEHFIAAINRVGVEEYGDNDFYGQSYFCDPRGQMVGEVGDPYKPDLIVRDLDLDLIREVRDGWAFYRDRRPDAYEEIVAR